MSKLSNLINTLCPDGVEYKPLTDIFNTRNDSDLIKMITGKYQIEGTEKENVVNQGET